MNLLTSLLTYNTEDDIFIRFTADKLISARGVLDMK